MVPQYVLSLSFFCLILYLYAVDNPKKAQTSDF